MPDSPKTSPDSSGTPEPAIGEGTIIADRFQIIGPLARGSAGTVYNARDNSQDKLVALKVVCDQFASGQGLDNLTERFRLAARLMHPNIIVPQELAQMEDGRPYLVGTLAPGSSLEQEVKEKGPLDAERAIAVCRQIAAAYQYAHSKGVSHILKGADVILVKGERERDFVKIVGFGLSAEDINRCQAEKKMTAEVGLRDSFSMTKRAVTKEETAADLQSFAQLIGLMVANGGKGKSAESAETSRLRLIAEEAARGPDCYPTFFELQQDLDMVLSGQVSDWKSKGLAQRRRSGRDRRRLTMIGSIVGALVLTIGGISLIYSTLIAANRNEAGEQRNSLWPPPKPDTKAIDPAAEQALTAAVGRGVGPTAWRDNMDKLAGYYQTTGQFKKEEEVVADAIAKKGLTANRILTAPLYVRVATACLRQDKLPEARTAAQETLKLLENFPLAGGKDILRAGSVIAEVDLVDLVDLKEGKLDQDLKVLNRIGGFAQAQVKNDCPIEFGLFASRMGDLFRALDRPKDAEAAYVAATQVWQLAGPEHHIDLAKALYGLAMTYQDQEEMKDAESTYARALLEMKQEPGRGRLTGLIQKDYADLLSRRDPIKSLTVRVGL